MNNQVDNHGPSTETSTNKESKNCWRKLIEVAVNWLSYKDKDRWLDKMRGTMSIVATFIATITIQMALNPPGGIRPMKDHGDPNPDREECYSNSSYICPGEAVLAVIYPDDYFKFLLWNTICFIASLTVCLMLVTGIRFSHRFSMWLLSMAMCFTLTTLAVTYRSAVSMVTPNPVWDEAENLLSNLLHIWIVLFCFFALLLTLRIIIWGIYDLIKKGEKATTSKIRKETAPA